MSKDTNPALAEHSVPDAPAAPVSQAVQTIPPAQAAVEIPQFASPTQEARYHILQYLTKNRGIPQRCSAIVQAVRERNASISRNAIDTALYELTSRRQLLKDFTWGISAQHCHCFKRYSSRVHAAFSSRRRGDIRIGRFGNGPFLY